MGAHTSKNQSQHLHQNQTFPHGAKMPHLTTSTAVAGARPAEVETDEVPTEDATAVRQASPARTTARLAGTKKGGPKGPRTTKAAGTGTGTGTGAGRSAVAAKPAAGRRKKLFDTAVAQAAYERAQDLKGAFSALQKAVKAPLNEIADRSITELLEDATAVERTPEWAEVQQRLGQRLQDQQSLANKRRQTELAMARHVLDGEIEAINRSTDDQIADLCDEAYGQLLDQLDNLERLHDAGLPLDLPAVPKEDADYFYKDITQEEADTQGTFIEKVDGAYIPVSGKPVSELMIKKEELTMPASPKRKAEDQPEGQPAPKAAAVIKDDEDGPKLQRHPAGLLAAVEALENRASETPPSNAPSPRPELLDAPSPGGVDQARTSGVTTPRDPLEIPIPRGASSSDEHGVRLISRKATQMNIPNNRIMVPMPFYFEDHEIGFRDSTNSLQKGATKARRGRYLDKPNSNYMFIDRRVGTWDSTNPEDEFDQALIKKHRLHPSLGIVLPSSINDWEPPKPFEKGWNPVVLRAPDGKEIHASRTIAAARLDRKLQEVENNALFRRDLSKFCQQHGIPEQDVSPDEDILREYRRNMLMARGMDPDYEVPSEISQEDTHESLADNLYLAGFQEFIEETLQAASILDAGEEVEHVAAPNPSQPAQSSRPYDAIRDVFTDTSSAQPQPIMQPAGPIAGQDPSPPADTFNLSCLADAAEQRIDGFVQQNDNDFLRTTLNPQPSYPPPGAPLQDYHPDYPPPTGAPLQDYSTIPSIGSPSQGSLASASRTPFSNAGANKGLPALRPVRSLLNDSPPPPEAQPQPQPQDSPVLQHPNMVVSNSGAFFPPAPNRPFHTGFSIQEQAPPQPMQPGMPPQPMVAPIQGSIQGATQVPNQGSIQGIQAPIQGPPQDSIQPISLPGPPAPQHQEQRQVSPYAGSPPDYHGIPTPIAPAPPMTGPPAPILIPGGTSSPVPSLCPAPLLPAGLPQLSNTANQASPATPSPRSRPGSSSASSSAKYRKLEPAPTPPHRMGYPGNGQELRTVQFDYREQIKDYTAMEAPPRHGPTHIRGWTHNNQSNIKKSRPSSKGDAGTDEPS